MDNNKNTDNVRFSQRLLSYLISALLAGQPVAPALAAAITPTGSAKMDQAANGVPVVNIATPNGAGVSHNQFKDYNVGKEGLILNNATGKLNQTQLGGLIQGNPNLKAGQEAKGIINEVTGGNRSQLQGYTEVAGKAANVMVANPYGITCNGCGFINTPNATLTTGKPQFDAAGNLLALDVSKGSIIVEGQGLDASGSDALSIIARATEVNAAIHAKDLSVTVGANRVAADGSTQAIAGEGAVPSVAVDSSALGGMYANRIRLVSSDKGVGINLGNLNARQGDITLDASGKITLNNSLASGSTTINAQSVALGGDHKAGGNLAVTSAGDITQSQGSLNTDKDLQLSAGGKLTLSNSLAAGNSLLTGKTVALSGTHRAGNTLSVSGQDIALNSTVLTADSNLQLTADGKLAQNGGKLTAGQDMALTAQTLTQNAAAQADAARNIALNVRDSATIQGKMTAAQQLALSGGSLSNSGQLAAGGAATVKSTALANSGTLQGGSIAVNSTTVTNTGSMNSAGVLDISAQNITLQGSVGAKGKTTLSAAQTLANKGSVISDDALTINATTLAQDGTLSGAKGLSVTASTLTSGAKSVTHSDAAVTLNAQTATLNGETSAGTSLAVKGQQLTTQAGAQLQSGADMRLEAAKTTLGGTQAAKGALTVSATDSLTHSGNSTGSTVTLNAGTLTNSGVVESPQLTVNAKSLTNSGTLYSTQNFTLFADQITNQAQGVLYSDANLALSAPVLSNAGTISAPSLTIDSQTVTNNGLLQGSQTLSLLADSLDNQAAGVVYSVGDFALSLPELRNAGTIASDGQLTFTSPTLTNSGLLQGGTGLSAGADTWTQSATGRTLSGGTLDLTAATLATDGALQGLVTQVQADNWQHSGSLLATKGLIASINGTLVNQGDLLSQGDVNITSQALDNQGSLLSEGDMQLTGSELTNSGAIQGNRLTLNQDQIDNSGTAIGLQALVLQSRLAMAEPLLTLTNDGSLLTRGTLAITGCDIHNSGTWQGQQILLNAQSLTHNGSIQSADALTFTVSGNLTAGTGSKISANGTAALSALALANKGQWIAGNLTVKGTTLDNGGDITGVNGLAVALTGDLTQTGNMLSAGKLTLDSENITHSGRIQGGDTALTAASLTNEGRIQGDSALILSLRGELTNYDTLLSQGALTLTIPQLLNDGVIQGAGTSTLNITRSAQNDGKILSGGTLTFDTMAFTNTGWLQATDLILNASRLDNHGTLLAQQSAWLTGSHFANTGTSQATTLTLNHQTLSNAGTLLGNNHLNVTVDIVKQSASGNLFSGGDLLLSSTALTSLGQLVALGNLMLKLTDTFTAQNVIAAGKQLTIESTGNITNAGTLQGNGVTLTAGRKLINQGQITTGSTASNLSGTHIALTTGSTLQAGGDVTFTSRSDILLNGFTGVAGSLTLNATSSIINTALLYAGNNLMLLADSIQNLGGDILAGNNLWMQKDATGTANAEVINRSGTIETVNGDITINTAHLLNSWDSLSATHQVIPGNDTGTLSPRPPNNWWQIKIDAYGPHLLVYWTPAPAAQYRVQMGDKEVVTVRATGSAGRIASGGNMTINAANLENEASFLLAGGNMRLSGDTLSNQGWQEGTSVTESVWTLDNSRRYVCGAYDCKGYRLSSQTTTEIDGKTYRAVISAGGSVDASFTRDISNTTTTANAGGVPATLTAPTLNTLSNQTIDDDVQAESLTDADNVAIGSPEWQDQLNGALQQISGGGASGNTPDASTPGKVDTSVYPLPSGNDGYFVTSTDPDSPYLITVNPKLDGLGQLDESLFGDLYALLGIQPGQDPREANNSYTDQNPLLGSAYFLDLLNLNPDYDYRFLGDAAFDTRYASNYILNQTGSRYINGVGSDLEQMRKLVDNAAAASQRLGLTFGMALTAEQIAALDSSIIWWEAAVVNGQTVMVPKVYLSPKDVTVHNGSVISASDVWLAADNVTNSGGTLVAHNNLTASSQNSLNNLNAGLIRAANGLQLSALGDINNVSSAISGKTVSLESIGGSISNTTLMQRLGIYSTGQRGERVNLTSTRTGNTASISATDGLLMNAGQDITVTGANVSAGGSLTMLADDNISVSENQQSSGYTGTDFLGKSYGNNISNQGSSITAGNDLTIQAVNDLTLSASSVNAGGMAQLTAGNDLNLNSAATTKNNSYGGSEYHTTGVDRTTISAGNDLELVAGRDLHSQAAGLAGEGSVGLEAGRDVNLMAEATTKGNNYRAKKIAIINESVRQQTTEIASGGNTMIIAGRDVNSQAAQVTAQGDIGVAADRDINLDTATESDYRYFEKKKTKKGFLKKKTTHVIEEDNATRELGTLLSGDNVTLSAGNNLLVKGSAVVGDGDVSLSAGNQVDIVAATNTDSTYRLKETKKSGLMGTGGIGFSIGSAKSRSEMKENGTTQSQSFSTVGSTGGNVNITADGQAHIGGADLVANKDLSITGDNVVIEPGRDQRTRDERYEQKTSGLTVALSGTVGSAVNSAVSSAQSAKNSSDSRLAALHGTQSVLSGAQAVQAVAVDAAKGASDVLNTNTIGVTASLGSQSSKSSSHLEQTTSAASTLSGGNDVNITATGSDITLSGTQVKAGKDVVLDAARDVNLLASQDTQSLSGENKSSGGSIGVGIGVGSGGYGINVSASGNSSKGREKGNGVWQNETTVDAGNQVTLTSGRDTTLAGAQVSGNQITADVGRDLTITSTQDSDYYNSKQTSISGGASFSFGSMTGSGNINASRDKINSSYTSVQEQSGLFAGSGGFDVTVGKHTQLDGSVIASTATPDKNSLDTGTLGWNDIHNKAKFTSQHSGAGISTGGSVGDNFLGNMGNTLAVAGSNRGNAEGTTKAAISEGSVAVRDKDNQQQNVAMLNRDVENANGSIAPIFDKEKEQRRLQEVQLIAEIGNQAGDIARTQGEITALNAGKAELATRGLNEPGQDASAQEKAFYQAALAASPAYKAAMQEWGTGSDIQRAIQSVTGALQGLAGGDIGAALAGASAPQLAHLLKETEGNTAVNTLAHAILGGAVASLQGGNVLAGAAGAASAELAARAIMAALYPGKETSDLTEAEKQKISALATIAAGLAGGLVGDSTGSAATGAQSGKNAVENNALSDIAEALSDGTTPEQKAKKHVEEENERYRKENCVGMSAEACAVQMYKDRIEGLKDLASFGVDFVPIVGDIKSYAEAESALDYLAATIGLVPGLGDVAGKTIKSANKALKKGDLTEASTLINKASDEISAYNVATYPKLKDDLIQQNLNNIAKQDPRLAAVIKGDNGKLNYGIGSGTKAEADRLGKIWVGDGARPLSDGKGLISADGTRVYRYPASKPNTPAEFSPTGVQANFETLKDGKKVGNAHMVITQ